MKKVVVVEDEELVRRGIVMAVDWESVDCAVAGEASNGQDGLAVIRRVKPEVIVTDVKMPLMDGLEMVRRLREEGNDAIVIFLTAYSDFVYAQTAVKLGVSDYLLKPFRDGELEEAVRRLLERAPAVPAASGADSKKSKYVAMAVEYMERNYGREDMSLGTVAEYLGLSEGYLSQIFKRETGVTPNSYLTRVRMNAAKELLRDCRSKVYQVAEQVGYRDITYFSSTFKKTVGMSPSEFQKSVQD